MVKMERELKGKYLLAAFITAIIFLLGLFLGMTIEGKRVLYIEKTSKEQQLAFEGLQLQYNWITQLSQEKNCPAIFKTFEDYIDKLAKSQERLETYSEEAKLDKADFLNLKREYLQAELNAWLLAERVKTSCNESMMSTILYFYSTDRLCPTCGQQALVLSYLKGVFKEKVLIFSIDSSLEQESMIPLLKSIYLIAQYPTLIVDGKKFEGLAAGDELLKEICVNYEKNETPDACKNAK